MKDRKEFDLKSLKQMFQRYAPPPMMNTFEINGNLIPHTKNDQNHMRQGVNAMLNSV